MIRVQYCTFYGIFYSFITVPLICTQCTVYAVNITKLLTLIASIRVKNIGLPKPVYIVVYSLSVRWFC
jgi:hypothetical protein